MQTLCCFYISFRRGKILIRSKEAEPIENSLHGNRNQGNQWKGERLTYNACTHKDSTEVERFLFEAIRDQRVTIERIYAEKERLQEENDGLWNEYLSMKEQIDGRKLPILDMRIFNEI